MKQIVGPCHTLTGAIANCHRISEVRMHADGATVIVNHFATEESTILLRQEQYMMPFADMPAGAFPDVILEWLVAPGSPLAGLSIMVDTMTPLEKERARFKGHISDLRDKAVHGGFTVAGIGRFQSDRDSMNTIRGKAAVAARKPTTTRFRLANNEFQNLTSAQMLQVAEALEKHVSDARDRSWQLKEMVEAAPDVMVLHQIGYADGWPT